MIWLFGIFGVSLRTRHGRVNILNIVLLFGQRRLVLSVHILHFIVFDLDSIQRNRLMGLENMLALCDRLIRVRFHHLRRLLVVEICRLFGKGV